MNRQISEFRIVLVGKTGVGKSATGNTILGNDHFHKAASSKSVTKQCSLATDVIDGKTITVVDTPGWCDTELDDAKLTQETVKCIDMLYPGPHVFLLVLQIGRFTPEEKKTVERIQDAFGEGATKYTMILFTRGDDLESKTIDSYLKDAQEDLQALVSKCNDRYHVFNNKDKSHNQVAVLLQKIQDMVQHNGGECYTNTTYKLLEKYKKREAELQQEVDATKKEKENINAELQRRLQLMEQEQQRQRLREAELQGQISQMYTVSLITTSLAQMKIDENARKERENERHEHRRRMESEMQTFQQKQLISKYEAKILMLEEQHRRAQAEKEEMLRKQSKCIIS